MVLNSADGTRPWWGGLKSDYVVAVKPTDHNVSKHAGEKSTQRLLKKIRSDKKVNFQTPFSFSEFDDATVVMCVCVFFWAAVIPNTNHDRCKKGERIAERRECTRGDHGVVCGGVGSCSWMR